MNRSSAEQSSEESPPDYQGLSLRDVCFGSMDRLDNRFGRLLGRFLLLLFRGWVLDLRGLEKVQVEQDPFILVLNHNQRLEALLVPTLLIHQRRGRTVRFLGDWNFLMIPVVAQFYRRSRVIIITRKDAKPKFLNRLKPLFEEKLPAMTRALHALQEGDSVGVFPEGRVNRDPGQLLRGSPGAARLSIESGAPIIPAGIRFPGHDASKPIGDLEKMTIEIGDAMHPPLFTHGERAPAGEVRAWHDRIMLELARLSGKQWPPAGSERERAVGSPASP